MTSKIFKFLDLPKSKKYRYLENKNFFIQVKRFIDYPWIRATIWIKKVSSGELLNNG